MKSCELIEFPVPYLGQYTTSYLLRTEHYNVFIDSAIRSNEPNLLPYLDGERKNVVLLTHGHWDHIGCNGLIKAHGGVVWASREDLPWLTDFDLHWDIGFGQFLDEVTVPPERKTTYWSEIGEKVTIDRWLTEGEVLVFDGLQIRVIALPGHSKGCLGYYVEEDSVLFTGDALMETGFFGGLAQYFDAASYRESMRKIMALDPGTVYTAHTPVYADHSAAKAAEIAIAFSEKIEADVREYVSGTNGPIRIGEVARYVTGKEGKKLGCGACICVMNHLVGMKDPAVDARLDLTGKHVGI